jgi:hypothetical protein
MLSKVKNEKLTTTWSCKGTELTAASVNFHSVRTMKNWINWASAHSITISHSAANEFCVLSRCAHALWCGEQSQVRDKSHKPMRGQAYLRKLSRRWYQKIFREINQDLCWGGACEMQNTSQGAPVGHKNLHARGGWKMSHRLHFWAQEDFNVCIYCVSGFFFWERLIWVFSVVVSHGRCSSSRDPCGEHLNSFKKVTDRESEQYNGCDLSLCSLLLGHFPLRLTHPSRMRSLGIYFIVLPTRWIKYAAVCVCLGRESKMRLTLAPTHALRSLGYFVLCGEVSSSSPPWRA